VLVRVGARALWFIYAKKKQCGKNSGNYYFQSQINQRRGSCRLPIIYLHISAISVNTIINCAMSKCLRCHKFFISDETKVPTAEDPEKFTHEICEAREPPKTSVNPSAAIFKLANGLPLDPPTRRHCSVRCVETQRWGTLHCSGCRGHNIGCNGQSITAVRTRRGLLESSSPAAHTDSSSVDGAVNSCCIGVDTKNPLDDMLCTNDER